MKGLTDLLLLRLAGRHHDGEFLIQRRGNAFQHRKRPAFVVSIFKPADHGLGRLDQLGKLLLRQAGSRPHVMNESGHFGIDPFLLERGLALWIVLHVATVKDTDGVLRPVLLGHSRSLLIGMARRIFDELNSVGDCAIDFRWRDDILLRASVTP